VRIISSCAKVMSWRVWNLGCKIRMKPTMIPNVACPTCGGLSPIDYINRDQEYIWWCDGCGHQYKFTWSKDGDIVSSPTGTIVSDTAVLLKLKPTNKVLYLIVGGRKFNTHEENLDRYEYEERSCPTNYLKNILEVYSGDEYDPHGLFEYIETIDHDGEFQCVGPQVGLDKFKNLRQPSK